MLSIRRITLHKSTASLRITSRSHRNDPTAAADAILNKLKKPPVFKVLGYTFNFTNPKKAKEQIYSYYKYLDDNNKKPNIYKQGRYTKRQKLVRFGILELILLYCLYKKFQETHGDRIDEHYQALLTTGEPLPKRTKVTPNVLDRSKFTSSKFDDGEKEVENVIDSVEQDSVEQDSVEHAKLLKWNGLILNIYMFYGCPYCNKVDTYAKLNDIPLNKIEVNMITSEEVKQEGKKYGDYGKVPLLIVKDIKTGKELAIKDSTKIISLLESVKYSKDKSWNFIEYLNNQAYAEVVTENDSGKKVSTFNNIYNVMYGNENTRTEDLIIPTQQDIAREIKMRQFTQDELLHTIAPMLYADLFESFSSTSDFIQMSPKYSESNTMIEKLKKWAMIFVGAIAMYFVAKGVKSKHKIMNTEDKFRDVCETWAKNLPVGDSPKNSLKYGNYSFMSGTDEPGIADIEAFSLLLVVENTVIFEALEQTPMLNWYNKMKRYYVKKTGVVPEEGVMLMSQ